VYLAESNVQLTPGDIVVDLGANQGLFSLLAAHIAEKVIAVEAQSGMHEQYLGPRLAHCHNVHLIHGLIAARTGVFARREARSVASHWDVEPQELTFSELMRQSQIDRVDFLKCDIEGSEFALFEEGDDWLASIRRIALEFHCEFGDVASLAARLRQFGFQVRLRDSNLLPIEAASNGTATGYLYAWRNVPTISE
jgi:FkbM family methyltransferase